MFLLYINRTLYLGDGGGKPSLKVSKLTIIFNSSEGKFGCFYFQVKMSTTSRLTGIGRAEVLRLLADQEQDHAPDNEDNSGSDLMIIFQTSKQRGTEVVPFQAFSVTSAPHKS